MKTNKILFALATAALVIWSTGCDKKDADVQKDMKAAESDASAAMKNAADAAKQTGEKVVADVKETGEKVAKNVAAKADELAAPVNTKAQEIIDATKKFISDGKLQDAMAKLKELGGEKLSAEQQTIADGLKAQIDKLLGTTSKATTDAATAAGNLLKK
jgi:hypothetical protein